jgi:uncharacterized protein (DUF1786 family)
MDLYVYFSTVYSRPVILCGMKILTVDVGTGTQDIYLYDSRFDIENGFKMVVPSPTMMLNRRLKAATKQHRAVLLTGVIMGGGPSQWAAEAHVRRGLAVYATPQAARSFNDDLEAVKAMGITVVSEDEARRLPQDVHRLEMCDFNFTDIVRAFETFGVTLEDLAALAVAVFDHGDAPVGVSDRQFRFDYLDERIRQQDRLRAFAYRAEEIPPIMTRMQAVADSARKLDLPLVIMDTAPAAVLGATFDPLVAARERIMIANVGNMHTLAFRLGKGTIEGVFEHHTGLIDLPRLEGLLISLANGRLQNQAVFDDHGHGALVYSPQPLDLAEGPFGVVITGPRRNLMRASSLRPYFATPFGDMMMTGCFGLLSAVADMYPEFAEPILASLKGQGGCGTAPWENDE